MNAELGLIGLVLTGVGYWGWTGVAASPNRDSVTLLLYAVTGGMIVFGLVFVVIALALTITSARRLTVSPQGIEYNEWPLYPLSCAWADVVRLEQGADNGRTFARLILPDRSPRSASANDSAGNTLGPNIRVSDFEGWPGGALEREIREYAPHLFAANPVEPVSAKT